MKHINLSPNRKGDFAEYYAVTWLWDHGYEVFKNCGCTGMIDLIARDPKGHTKLIDVKTFRHNHNGPMSNSGHLSQEQKDAGIQILGFNPKTRDLRFVDHRVAKNYDWIEDGVYNDD